MKGKYIKVFFYLLLFINIVLILYIVISNTNKIDSNGYMYCNYYGHPYIINDECLIDGAIKSTTSKVRSLMLELFPKLNKSAADAMAYSIVMSSEKFDVNPLYATIVSFVESGFNPAAISHSGAKGIFQVMEFNKISKHHVDFGINSDSGIFVLKKCLNLTNNNCLHAYLCYVFGENGYKVKVNDQDIPPSVYKLSILVLNYNIKKCEKFEYY
ncbi:MAG: transglycosylase SLT domain-containing protein [candidate division WOR-3 bacterium]